MTAALADLGIERLVSLDRIIDDNESTAIRARWEFGREMLAARGGDRRLPNGYLAELVKRTGKSRRELKYRAQFAAAYTEEELGTVVPSFGSWTEVRESLKRVDRAAYYNAPVQPQPVADGEFRTFVADPPWRYDGPFPWSSVEDHYSTMTLDEMCSLDVVPEHAADQAHLYLWTTAEHLPQAFEVMKAWEFEYKTYLVWVKPQMGMGNYFRMSTELVVFGVKGGMRTQARDIKNWFEAKRGRHSAKPLEFHDLVEAASPGPYMELFSRCCADRMPGCTCSKCRLGWSVWGDQS
jgi:N6-adenosine-specific RNA methylase IME4